MKYQVSFRFFKAGKQFENVGFCKFFVIVFKTGLSTVPL